MQNLKTIVNTVGRTYLLNVRVTSWNGCMAWFSSSMTID